MATSRRRKLTEDEVIERYEEWDPADSTILEFCERNAISKPWLYALLRRRGVTPKSFRGAGVDPDLADLLEQIEQTLERLEGKLDAFIEQRK